MLLNEELTTILHLYIALMIQQCCKYAAIHRSEANCSDKTSNKRHPKPCKKWAMVSCKFNDLCDFLHDKSIKMEQNKTEDFKENNSDKKQRVLIIVRTTMLIMTT